MPTNAWTWPKGASRASTSKARRLRGQVFLVQGDLIAAEPEMVSALQVAIDEVAAGLTDTSLRETFLTSPHVQQIRQRASQIGG